jgi:hypothetical protein
MLQEALYDSNYTPMTGKREDLKKFSLFLLHLSQSLNTPSVQSAESAFDALFSARIGVQ